MAKQVQLEVKIKGSDSVGQAAEKTKTLKQELRDLKQELASGSLTGEAFDKAAKRAGELQDRIGDVNQKVKNLASDTSKLDGFISIAEGITGGFAAAQGAMALFGDENEDLQKSLIKVQGAIALLNGVQAVANTLQKESAAITTLNTIKTNILTFAQARYTAAVGGTTGVLKVLRIVGMTLGIGLIVAAIGLLVANFDKVQAMGKKLIDRFNGLGTGMKTFISIVMPVVGVIRLLYAGLEKLGVFAESAADKLEKIETASKSLNKQRERDIQKLEALGGAEDKIFVKRLAMLNQDKLILMQKKLLGEATDEEIEQIKDLGNEIDILKIKEKQRLEDVREAQIKEQKERDKAYQERLEKEKEQFLAKQRNEINLRNLQQQQLEDLANFEQQKNDIINQKAIEQSEIEDQRLLEQAKKDQEYREFLIQQETEIADFQINERQRVQDAQVSIAGQTADLLGQIAGRNKQLAMAALILEKGAAAASVIINAQREKASNAVMAAANPLNVLTGGAAGQAQLASLNAFTNLRTGLSLATIAATGINGAKNISGSGGGGGVQPPNVSGTQTDFNRPTTPQPQKVYILETEIRSSMRKVDDIYTQATIS